MNDTEREEAQSEMKYLEAELVSAKAQLARAVEILRVAEMYMTHGLDGRPGDQIREFLEEVSK